MVTALDWMESDGEYLILVLLLLLSTGDCLPSKRPEFNNCNVFQLKYQHR